jgi:tetratricopeptide (TPR) repeat protein
MKNLAWLVFCLSFSISELFAAAQSKQPSYLNQFPSVEQIKADVRGVDEMETAAKQAGIFWQLQQLVSNLAYSQHRMDRQFTPDEQRMSVDYRNGYYSALQLFEGKVAGDDKPRWFELHTKYELDTWLLDEVLKKYFAPETRRSIYVALKGQMPTTEAPPKSRLAPSASELAAAKVQNRSNNSGVQPAASENLTAKDYVAKGDAYLDAKKDAEALDAFEHALKLDPTPATYLGIGVAAQGLKQYDKALYAFQQAVRLKPNDAGFQIAIGFFYEETSQYEKAIAAYKEAIRLQPQDKDAKYFLGRTYYKSESFSEAAVALKEASRLDPRNAQVLYKLGETYLETGQKTEAAQVLQTLQNVDQKIAAELRTAYDFLFQSVDAKTMLELGDAATFAEGVGSYGMRFFRRAIALDKRPETLVHAYRSMGRLYSYMKKPDKAIASLQKALQIAPNDADSHLWIGYSYLDFGKKAEALQEYKILQRLDRKNAQMLYAQITK